MTDPRIEAFFAEAPRWRAELGALRALLRSTDGIEEVWKWRQPCYVCAGGNTAMVAGLAERCVLSFFKGVLLPDPDGLLVPPGPNSRSARYVAFHDLDEIRAREPALRDLLRAAVEIDRAGRRVTFPQDDIVLPDELEEALAADPELAAAFEALTPGRQRGYAILVSGAKKPETRFARIAKHAPRILAGKGMHDR
ncbi:YdeI/OmpD-associated family protein [Limimaricola pyoseonensis]|uniref:Uncharacterized conserved protein YdeI, YjbR/CyaY-like superfamily, DUF1801 family n=1 Tax=Limimaricola pyoseonensis TaxID=521013 RepID=A0A1G7CIH1_9RHOB|nr:YdeI/OmpD-associated family protein [Limimaricola pyoseonensis]SDE39043.1 Uncharacterized conserved protein YdeI, YjbR/CyaY-like superfamily, DUF1801 family [Limimaricola pyoseonensis]